MKTSPLIKAVRRALLPIACATLLSACAYYDPVTGTMVTAPPYGAPADNPAAVFDRLDTNRDGYLSRGEVEVLGMARAAPPVVDVTVSFQRLDVNRDGFLSREEAASTMGSIPGATFDQIDANRDGFLSTAEAAPHLRWLESRGAGAAWFDQLDANRDGFLSRPEADPLVRSTRFVGGRWEVGPMGAPMGAVATFDQLDTNRDGYLSRTESAPVLGGPATFDQHDSNRDGFLSRAEADVLLRSGVGVTYPPYGGGAVYGPR